MLLTNHSCLFFLSWIDMRERTTLWPRKLPYQTTHSLSKAKMVKDFITDFGIKYKVILKKKYVWFTFLFALTQYRVDTNKTTHSIVSTRTNHQFSDVAMDSCKVENISVMFDQGCYVFYLTIQKMNKQSYQFDATLCLVNYVW